MQKPNKNTFFMVKLSKKKLAVFCDRLPIHKELGKLKTFLIVKKHSVGPVARLHSVCSFQTRMQWCSLCDAQVYAV